MKKALALFLLLTILNQQSALASKAYSQAETQVEGSDSIQVHQSVETTVNGKTVRKESNQPGKLSIRAEEEETTASPSPKTSTPAHPSILSPSHTPSITTPGLNPNEQVLSFGNQPKNTISFLIDFLKNILSKIFKSPNSR